MRDTMSPGLQAAVLFAGSLPGHILLSLGQTLVVVCLCFDFVRAVSVPRSHRRYVANTAFRTLALPSILVMAFSVLSMPRPAPGQTSPQASSSWSP